jgi:hypothetical protein
MKSLSFEYKVTGPWSDPIVVKQGQVSPVDAERAKEVLQKGRDDKEQTPPANNLPPAPAAAPASPRRQPAPGPAINSGA